MRKFATKLFVLLTSMSPLVASSQAGSGVNIPTFNSPLKAGDAAKIQSFLTGLEKFNNPYLNDNNQLPSIDTSVPGVCYEAQYASYNGLSLPLSYYSTKAFWSDYVCQISGNNCTVSDNYNSKDYTLTPDTSNSDPGQGPLLQIERINVANGSDIYDAACWQIALSLLGETATAENQNQVLKVAFDGNTTASQAKNSPDKKPNRAFTNWNYQNGNTGIRSADNAYFFRMVTQNWQSIDPLADSDYVSLSGSEPKGGWGSNGYGKGVVTWLDYKPITGENAWAFFEGPMITEYLKSGKDISTMDLNSDGMQNAINILPAFLQMQSSIGGIYYAVKGSLGNVGGATVNPNTVSIENNASALAGLWMLRQVLSSPNNAPQYAEQIKSLNTLIYGDTKTTTGVLCFLKNQAWNDKDGIYRASVLANTPDGHGNSWTPDNDALKAVDVNTWGMTVLGQPFVDGLKADGTYEHLGRAYQVWQNVKRFGGYCGGTACSAGSTILGVGYSNEDKNAIMSAEWTAGAVNMVRALITQYSAIEGNLSGDEWVQVQSYIKSLTADHDSMVQQLPQLSTDHYGNSSFSGVPEKWNTLMGTPWNQQLAFVYASKRYAIPFGWTANPLPSTTSTSWMIMLDRQFNPFQLDGSYTAINYSANIPQDASYPTCTPIDGGSGGTLSCQNPVPNVPTGGQYCAFVAGQDAGIGGAISWACGTGTINDACTQSSVLNPCPEQHFEYIATAYALAHGGVNQTNCSFNGVGKVATK